MNIRIDLSTSGIFGDVRAMLAEDCEAAKAKLWSGKEDFTGWVSLPEKLTCEAPDPQAKVLQGELADLKETAEEIKGKCDLFVVVGIGGSYMGAKCVIDAIAPHEELNGPKVVFAGYNMSAAFHREIIEEMREKETCLCVISKSGGTTEPLAAFSILKDVMSEKYAGDATSRIYAITDRANGRLREEADEKGYKTFIVPDDIGGRYSVLTSVGLLPAAVAGIDIGALLEGAKDMAADPGWRVDASEPVANVSEQAAEGEIVNAAAYAMTRVALSRSGKWIEIFEYFHPELDFFAEWLKQLFGESEGKEGKGIFPASLMFTRDLHSMGQFIQQGKQMFFETMIIIEDRGYDITIPESAGAPLAGKTLEQINECAIKGVAAAHTKAGVPVIKIYLPKMDAYNMGQLIYFFEMTCGIAAYISGVNPFDQPGVEAYKAEMRAEIEKL
jgi:glucose-6-phosphate isomerase